MILYYIRFIILSHIINPIPDVLFIELLLHHLQHRIFIEYVNTVTFLTGLDIGSLTHIHE